MATISSIELARQCTAQDTQVFGTGLANHQFVTEGQSIETIQASGGNTTISLVN
jgi:hypothetical protein